MSLRDRLARVAPGLFTPAVLPAERKMDVVRAATFNLYSGVNGGFQNPATIVPSLDYPNPENSSADEDMKSNPFLFSPIWRIAFRMGALPLKVYKFKGENDGPKLREEDQSHPAYQLLRRPNPDIPSNLLISGTVMSMFVAGKAGWVKVRQSPFGPAVPENPVKELWPVPGNTLFVKRGEKRIIAGYEIRVAGQAPIPLAPQDVCYFRLMPHIQDWANGMSPVGPLGDTLDFGEEAIETMTELFQTAFLQRIWINLNGGDLDEEQLARLRSEMELARRSRWGVPIMESGATIESMGTYGSTVEDALLTNAIDLCQKIVQHTFALPNDEENLQMFYGEVIQPIADSMEKELERSLMPEFSEEAFPEFQFREILAGSPIQRADLWQKKILSGQATPNEARRAENMEDKEGGDDLLVPLNVGKVKDLDGRIAETREKGSSNGLGGQEGKGIVPTGPAQPRAASVMRVANEETAQANWSLIRSRLLVGQSEAMERRLRGVMNEESRALLAGKDPAEVFRNSDASVTSILSSFMLQVGGAAWAEASNFLDPGNQAVPDAEYSRVVSDRAQGLASMFGAKRAEELVAIREAEGADADIKARWDEFARHLAEAIARHESRWAFDQAAVRSWAALGFSEIGVVRTGTHCSTGSCDQAARTVYGAADVPTPLHPGCECYAVPAEFTGRSAMDKLEKSIQRIEEAVARPIPAPVVHIQPPEVNVQVEAPPAPVVNVTPPEVNPVVHVAPPEVVVNVPPAPKRKMKRTITRDKDGMISGVEDEDE